MTQQPFLIRDLHTTQNQISALRQPVNIISLSDPHIPSCILSLQLFSAGLTQDPLPKLFPGFSHNHPDRLLNTPQMNIGLVIAVLPVRMDRHRPLYMDLGLPAAVKPHSPAAPRLP